MAGYPLHLGGGREPRGQRDGAQIALLSPRAVPEAWNGLVFDGLQEYQAGYKESTQTGWLAITSRWKAAALYNFLRNFGAWLVVRQGGIVLHAACVVKRNRAYIFRGRSGAGKTTVCRLSKGAQIAHDDLTAIRVVQGQPMAWGMPSRPQTKKPAPPGPFEIAGLFKLVQAKTTRLEKLSPMQALAELFCMPQNIEKTPGHQAYLRRFEKMIQKVPCHRLYFKKSASFWKPIHELE